MKTIKAKIVKKTRNISEGTTPDSNVPAFDQMYYTFEIEDMTSHSRDFSHELEV